MHEYDVSVIVPVLNERDSLEELFQRVDRTLSGEGLSYELIFVNDGSTDDSLEVMKRLRNAHPQIGIVNHAKNYGKSMGLMQGMDQARGRILVTMDADLQEEPEDIPLLLAKIGEGYDMVGGHRHKRQDSLCKKFVSKVYNGIVELLTQTRFHDINCGFKAFTAEVKTHFNLRADMHRLMPAIAISNGYSFVEVPVKHHPRKYGTSKYPLLRHRGLLDLMSFLAQQTTQLRPFHIMSEVGVILLFLAGVLLSLAYFGIDSGDGQSAAARFLFFVLGGLGLWLGFVGTLLPPIGLLMENITAGSQDRSWRQGLAKETFPSA